MAKKTTKKRVKSAMIKTKGVVDKAPRPLRNLKLSELS